MTGSVWILIRNNGCEGYSEPQQAFASEQEAKAALFQTKSVFTLCDLFKMPLWPAFGTPEKIEL